MLLCNVSFAGDFIVIVKKKNDENVFFKHKGPDKKVAIKMTLEKCYKLFMYMMDKNGKLLSIEKSIKLAKKNNLCYVHEVVEQ